MKKFKNKQLLFTLIGVTSVALPFVVASCTTGERIREFDNNRLALLAFANKQESKKMPTIDLQKFVGRIKDIPLVMNNFRADVLWCLDAIEAPNSVTEDGKKYNYTIENVNHILGTTRAEITIGIHIDGFVNSDKSPVQIETYKETIDGFKLTPVNHKHWVKRAQKDTCEICLTFNN